VCNGPDWSGTRVPLTAVGSDASIVTEPGRRNPSQGVLRGQVDGLRRRHRRVAVQRRPVAQQREEASVADPAAQRAQHQRAALVVPLVEHPRSSPAAVSAGQACRMLTARVFR
jgi:hypothetical protein